MKNNPAKSLLSLLSLSFFSFVLQSPVLAHVVWFDYTNGKYELLFGHPELGVEPITIGKFQEAKAYNISRTLVPSTNNIQGNRIFVEPQGTIAALTAFYDNGFWVELPNGDYENLTRQQAEAINFQNVTNFVKYTKALYDWSDAISMRFNLPLEIIPLQNPFTLQTGETLPIQVFFDGNLINNPIVEYLGQTINVDANGIALIPIGNGGLQVIEASYQDPNASNPGISYAATLTAESVPEPSLLSALGVFGVIILAKKRK